MPDIYTIGHATRSIEDFISLLKAHGVERLVDIRTVPRSRRNPQFNKEELPKSLQSANVGYEHMGDLGGLRHARKDSPNTGWRNPSFRGYADYMQTPAFADAVERLITTSKTALTVIMCAESVPWRCHRSLVADALTVRGVAVAHIMSANRADPHRMTEFAVADGTRVWYPAHGQPGLF